MELRRQDCDVFFIRVIKKATVAQLINSSPSEVPAQKLRSLTDIYEDESTCHIPDAFLGPSGVPVPKIKTLADVYEAEKTLCSLRSNEASGGAIGILYGPTGDGSIRGEPNCCEALDDDGADDLTLRALRKICRSKRVKRKIWEDGSDLMMPLSNIRRKKKKMTPEQTASSSRLEDIENLPDTDHLQRGESSPGKCKIVEESFEPSCSNNHKGDGCSSSYSTLTTIMDVDARTGALLDDITRTSKVSTIMHEEYADCVIKKKPEETEKQAYQEVTCQSFQQISLSHPPDSEFMQNDRMTPQPGVCSSAPFPPVDRTSDEHDNSGDNCFTSEMTSQAGADPVPDLMATNVETGSLHNPEESSLGSQLVCMSPLLISEDSVQDDINVTPVPDVCLSAPSCSLDQTSDEYAKNEPTSLSHEIASPVISSPVKEVHVPDLEAISMEMGIPTNIHPETSTALLPDAGSLDLPLSLDLKSDEHEKLEVQCVINRGNDEQPLADIECEELSHRECLGMVKEQCGVIGASIEENLIATALDKGTQLASSTLLSCYLNGIARADEKQPLTFSSDVDTCCSATTESFDPFQSPNRDEPSMPYAAPERLFSGRKAISPNSQQRLCKGMEEIDSIDSREKLRSIGKLFSESKRRNRKHLMGKRDQIKRPGQLNNPAVSIEDTENEMKNKLKNYKSDLKITRLPSSRARAKNRCPSIRSCAERAISFSRGQLKDTEALAKKLTKELTCMRKIVAEKLNNGDTDDEVKTAISNASKAEATAKKWLLLMNRDCNRFQTVLEVNNKMAKTSPSEGTAHKDRRKIKFADEAGAELCQIKFIENCCDK